MPFSILDPKKLMTSIKNFAYVTGLVFFSMLLGAYATGPEFQALEQPLLNKG